MFRSQLAGGGGLEIKFVFPTRKESLWQEKALARTVCGKQQWARTPPNALSPHRELKESNDIGYLAFLAVLE